MGMFIKPKKEKSTETREVKIRIPVELKEWLFAYARMNDTTMSQICSDALQKIRDGGDE